MYCGDSCFDFYDGDIKMNNRIKELWNRSNHDEEVFAELIVKECIRVPYDMWDKAELNADIAVKIEHRIKQHFGVEEQEKVAPKPKCSVCGTTENVRYMGGYQPYLCDSVDCIPF